MSGPSEPAPTRGKSRNLPLLGLALAIALVFLAFLFASTEGHFVPPVVDLYLVCQYAKAIAEGHPFRYNPGEPPSTGATSLLYTVLLAAAHRLGFRSEGLIAFAVAAGIAFYAGSVLLARRIGERLGGPREGLLAGALVALGGPIVWGFLYGSDVALFMFLCLWLLDRLLADGPAGPAAASVGAASLLALARPEGLAVALLLGLVWTLRSGRHARLAARARMWVPAAAGLAVLALYRALTGSWLGSSFADKSLFDNYGAGETVAVLSEYAIDVIRGLLLGFYPSQAPVGFARGWAPLYFPPLALVLALAAWVAAPAPRRAVLMLWGAVLAVLFAVAAPNVFLGVHFNRYLMWGFPTVHVLAAAGLGALSRGIAGGDARLDRAAFGAAAAVCLALGALSTLRMAALYGEMAGAVYRRDVAAAQWIRRALPPGVAMANLATSVEYLTGHRNLNLHGVTSPAFFGNRTAERDAGVWESLARLPIADRPPYLLVTQSVLEAQPAMREMVEGPPLFTTASFGDEILVHRTRYDLVGRNARLVLPETLSYLRGLREVDRLNVCDARDEAAHRYRFQSGLGGVPLNGTVRLARYPDGPGGEGELVADGGRAILGGEWFRVRTSTSRDLVVVLRTAPEVSANVLRASGNSQFALGFAEAGLQVQAGGQKAGLVSFRPRSGWDEHAFRVPAHLLSEGTTELAVSGRYASFHYWFFQ